MRRFWLYIIFLTLMLGFLPGMTSCSQKDLIFPGDGMAVLDVRFEWPETLVDYPQGMTLWFFPLDEDGHIWRFDIAGHEGGPVELPYGAYSMISFNNDVAGIRISDTSTPQTIAADLRDSGNTPGNLSRGITPLYRARVERLEFTPVGIRWTEDGIPSEQTGSMPGMHCHPSKISTTYDLKVTDIEGSERILNAAFTFHGVCDRLLLLDAQSLGDVIDISSGFGSLTPDASLSSTFESFGPIPDNDDADIEVTITLKDRHTYRKTFDIGDQIANRHDRFFVRIIIGGISIPDYGEPPDDDVGMEVGVDGWTTVNIDYTTGP